MKILIIGGNRFFGKRLSKNLINKGHDVTLLNRGNFDDGLGGEVKRIKCDRNEDVELEEQLKNLSFDVVYDQVCYDFYQAKSICRI